MIREVGESYLIQRSMGVLAPVFVIMVIPELWKNRSQGAMEIEGASYFSIFLSLLWVAIWLLIVLQDAVYQAINMPIWIGAICCSFLYLIYTIVKLLKGVNKYWEGNTSWS